MDKPKFLWPVGKQAAVSLTFDDARPSQVDMGIPILNAHGVKATFYLSPPAIEQRLDLWRQVKSSGHEAGNHTMNHPCSGNFSWSHTNALENYSMDQMASEFAGANEAIRNLLGVTPLTFAYPCGQKYVGRGRTAQSYVPLVAQYFLVGRGFRDEAVNAPDFSDLSQVLGIDSDDSGFEYLKGWMDRAIREGGWLIFCSHDIGDYPRQAMHAQVLESVCQYASDPNNSIWIDTVAAVGSYILERRKSQGTTLG